MKNKTLYSLIVLPLFFPAVSARAQDTGAAATADPDFYDQLMANGLLLLAGIVVIAAFATLLYLLNIMVKIYQIRIYQEAGLEAFLEEVKKPKESYWQRIYKQLTKAVPVEKEKDVMFDHEYDGIRELDNSLPPWWVWLFYVTIGFAVVYMAYYHFTGAGLSSKEKYEQEMQKAEEAVAAFLARQSNLVDESNVVRLEDEQALSLGKSIFEVNCVACHGVYGEGGVGPNLTDEFWVHGGGIQNIFKTIKYGVPEKGMISWQSQLRPTDMQRVASYIMTLEGTNPPNPKAPEGERYVPEEAAPSPATDTTQQAQAIGMTETGQE